MELIHLRKVKRCPSCHHLIPYDFRSCPYCNGTIVKPEVETNTKSDEFVPVELTEKQKQILKYSGLGLAVMAVVFVLISFISDFFVMRKSICEPLDEKTVLEKEKDLDGFSECYSRIESIRRNIDENDPALKSVTYQQMYDFCNNYYDSYSYRDSIGRQALNNYKDDYVSSYQHKIDSIGKKWKEYIAKNDVNSYLKVSVVHNYYRTYGYDHPSWYFKISQPKGKISNCYASYKCVNKSTGNEHYNTSTSYVDLRDLMNNSTDATGRYFSSIYDDSFWDRYKMVVTVYSVTLSDGTVISAKNMSKVPQSVKNYLESPDDEYSLVMMMRDQVDPDFCTSSGYSQLKLEESLCAQDTACYRLLSSIRY